MRHSRFPLLLLLLVVLAGCRDDEEGTVTVQNDTANNVVAVFIDACGTGPGLDRLGGSVIRPGRREGFRVAFGCYDVLVRVDGGLEARWTLGVNASDRNWTVFPRGP
jgi:hypothetical protein